MRPASKRWTAAAILATAALTAAACSTTSSGGRTDRPSAASLSSVATSSQPAPAAAPKATRRAARPARPTSTTAKAAPSRVTSSARAPQPRPAALRLPLRFTTGAATQVITVVAPSASSTQGTLQAWRRSGSGWRAVGSAVHAWLGSDGLSRQPSETRSATPIGSFTLTRAFGHDADPGTALPYTRTTPDDWWISQAGPLYNTMQRCSSQCGFTQGDPNEHLYFETPYYDYAVVIDYNTRNAPGGVVQGAGSAFFLHVTVHAPTQGCVSVEQSRLIGLLRWLTPTAHPRILIGTPSS